MEIIALKEYTDKYISLYEGEIRNINQPMALRLIEQGIVANHEDQQEEKNFVLLTVEITNSQITNFEGTYSDIQEAYLAGKDIKLCVVNGNTHATKFVPLTYLTFKNNTNTNTLAPYIFYFRLIGTYCGADVEDWGQPSERRINHINDFTYISILYSNPLFGENGEPKIEIEVQQDSGTKVMNLEIQIKSYNFDINTSTSITSLKQKNTLTTEITRQNIMDALEYYHREIRVCLAASGRSDKYYLYLSGEDYSSLTFCSSVIPSEQGSYFYQFKFYEKDDSRNLVTKVSI